MVTYEWKILQWDEKPLTNKQAKNKSHSRHLQLVCLNHFFSNVIHGKGTLDFTLEEVVIKNVCFCNLYMNGEWLVRFVNIKVRDLLHVVYSVNYPYSYNVLFCINVTGKKVSITCSTGIAATHYWNLGACSLHKLFCMEDVKVIPSCFNWRKIL